MNEEFIPPHDDEAEKISVKVKWQGAVTEGSGFVAIPMALLRMQTKYGLTATEMLVLVNLLAHWWDPSRAVFPRTTTIANRMGVDKRTVQRAVGRMARIGLLSKGRTEDGKRAYDFAPLAKRLAKDVIASYAIQRGERPYG